MRTILFLSLLLPACKNSAKVEVDEPDYLDDTAAGVPDIDVTPLSLDFGRVSPGVVVSGTFLVSNLGDAPLTVAFASGAVGYALDATTAILVATGTQTVTVTFSGANEGEITDVALVTSNDPDEPSVSVTLRAVVTDDVDQDGFPASDDCDDTDPAAYPGADEVWYDGVDNDCDGRSDYDQDGDGYDASDYGGDDCADTDAERGPGTLENPTNGIDDDCDGAVDEALSEDDVDGDGFSEAAGDCNDRDAAVNPGASETWYDGKDQDCDAGSDYDQDGDGHDADTYGGDDCDDTLAGVNPDVDENWYDGVDQDCDGNDDDQDGDGYVSADDCDDTDAAVNVPSTWYVDADGDGQGTAAATVEACDRPAGYSGSATDCDDTDASTYVAAPESCDGLDNDCDGVVDNDPVDATTWYEDADGDSFGNPDVSQDTCDAPAGYVADDTDCDDTDAAIFPGSSSTEVPYNGVDDDCDGQIDDMRAGDESSWTILGTSSSHAIGNTGVFTAPDMDGDGDAELVVAATTDDSGATNAGALAFHDDGTRGTDIDYTAGWLLVGGESDRDGFGSASVLLGDVDGDGYDEMAASAWLSDRNEDDAGAVFTFDLMTGTTAYSGTQDVNDIREGRIECEDDNAWLGYALAAGDLDDDGTIDLVASAPGMEDESGRVYLFTAGDGWNDDDIDTWDRSSSLEGESDDDHLGAAMVSADLDGDGSDDLVVCAPGRSSSRGECWFLTGEDALDADGDRIRDWDSADFTATSSDDSLGDNPLAIAAGDLDGDGTDDLAIGMPGYDGAVRDGGGVMIARGGSFASNYTPSSVDLLVDGDGALGTALSIPGDVDGDGVDDLLAGAPDAGAGVVYLLSNLTLGGTLTLPGDEGASWVGETSGDAFGTSVGGLQDLDNDGILDFAAAATGYDTADAAAGKVYVLPAF